MEESDGSDHQSRLPAIPRLVGDVRRLKQILMNLIRNALKFTRKGHISVSASYAVAPTNELIIKVQDTGMGIAAEDIPNLFTRFGKLQRTATVNSEGLGLGLNIVKQIAESFQGNVAVISKGVGHGSTFTVTLAMGPAIVPDSPRD